MTLIVNEITYDSTAPDQSRIICGADRQISYDDGRAPVKRRKLFKIEHLSAAVSYFGLADVDHKTTLEEFLDAFSQKQFASIEVCAHDLATELWRAIEPTWKKEWSGLHLAGFTENGVPQFWFIRNIQGMNGVYYSGVLPNYSVSEELSEVHQKQKFDHASKTFTASFGQWFANGDLRSHAPAWYLFDEFSLVMEQSGLASSPTTHDQFEARVKWKLETIGRYYEAVADEKGISPDVDTICLTHQGA